MDSLHHSLWLQTVLCLAAWLAGLVLHLKWHPHRRHLSDAWDLMTGMPWLIITLAATSLLAQWLRPTPNVAPWTMTDLSSWRQLALPLLLRSTETYAQSLHALFPPWPLAMVLPFMLTALAWRLHRLPYRYATRKQSDIETLLLWLTVLAAWTWVASEIIHASRLMPEWLESARLTLRILFAALTMAVSQILLIRIVIAWDEPIDPNQQSDLRHAIDHTFVRWRSAFALGVFDLLWLLWAQHQQTSHSSDSTRWLLIEAMLVFAPLPVAIAACTATATTLASLLAQGASAMRILLRTLLPWLGLIITAVASLMLVHYTAAIFQELTATRPLIAKAFLPLRALVLATVHTWLFLATVFIFIRHGLKPAAASPSAA